MYMCIRFRFGVSTTASLIEERLRYFYLFTKIWMYSFPFQYRKTPKGKNFHETMADDWLNAGLFRFFNSEGVMMKTVFTPVRWFF